MTALTGVLDANVVIGLAKGGVFDLLSHLYSRLYVPPSVEAEIVRQGHGLPGEPELTRALGVWVSVITPDPQIVRQFTPILSPADREVLAIARGQSVDHVLSGDRQLYREANRHGIICLRATDVIVLLKRRGLLTAVKSTLDVMRQRGFGIADLTYEEALRAAAEWPMPERLQSEPQRRCQLAMTMALPRRPAAAPGSGGRRRGRLR